VRCQVNAAAAHAGDKVLLGVRPEHFHQNGTTISPISSITDMANQIEATVTFVESLGSSTQAYFAFPGVEDALTCSLDGRTSVRQGDVLKLSMPPEVCYLFDADGRAFPRAQALARLMA